jgi:hypothetical protein
MSIASCALPFSVIFRGGGGRGPAFATATAPPASPSPGAPPAPQPKCSAQVANPRLERLDALPHFLFGDPGVRIQRFGLRAERFDPFRRPRPSPRFASSQLALARAQTCELFAPYLLFDRHRRRLHRSLQPQGASTARTPGLRVPVPPLVPVPVPVPRQVPVPVRVPAPQARVLAPAGNFDVASPSVGGVEAPDAAPARDAPGADDRGDPGRLRVSSAGAGAAGGCASRILGQSNSTSGLCSSIQRIAASSRAGRPTLTPGGVRNQ